MAKIMDVKNIFRDSDVVEVIKELNRSNRRAQLSTIFQELNRQGEYLHLHDPYLELAEKLIIMRSHNKVTWSSSNPNHLGASEVVHLVG